MMLWRRWGLGMLLPLSSSGYSPVSSRNMLSKCHEVALSNSVTFSSLFFSISPISGWFTVALESLKTLGHLFCPHSVYPTIPVIAPYSLFSPSHRPPHHSVPDRCHPPEPPQTPSTSSPASHVWPLDVLVPATLQLNMASEKADQITPVSALIPLLSHVKFVVKSIILTPTK